MHVLRCNSAFRSCHKAKCQFNATNAGMKAQWEGVVTLLLLLPFIGLLWVPFYNVTLFGFPFFYWYQIAWVPASSLLTYIVWRSQRRRDEP